MKMYDLEVRDDADGDVLVEQTINGNHQSVILNNSQIEPFIVMLGKASAVSKDAISNKKLG